MNAVGYVTLVEGLPNLLLRREPGKEQWQNLPPEKSTVGTRDALLALPGYRSEVRFDSGPALLLWGNLPEFLSLPLFESAVTLQPSTDADLELTLDRGRVLLSNRKGDGLVKVRVHFNENKPRPAETWDLTLQDPGTEVALDLFGRYTADIPYRKEGAEGPLAELYLVVLQGQASVKVDANTFTMRAPPAGPSLLSWDNKGPGVRPPEQASAQMLRFWDKANPHAGPADRAEAALGELLQRLNGRPPATPVELALEESLQSDKPLSRVLGVYCLGALDAVGKVLDALADDDERHPEVRDAAVIELRHWIGRRADNQKRLYQALVEEKRYTPSQAETVLQLLHDADVEQLRQPETWGALIGYLRSDKASIRNLAYWHLWRLVPDGRQARFSPAGDVKQREAAYEAWKKLIPDGQLPPKAPPPPKQVQQPDPAESAPSARYAAPVTDIWSGKALNEILAESAPLRARKAPGPRIELADEVLEHINVRKGKDAGNLGALRPLRGGRTLAWPRALEDSAYRAEVGGLNAQARRGVAQAQNGQQPDPGNLAEMRRDIERLGDKLRARINDVPPAQYLEARRFLDELADAVTALGQPDVAGYFDGKYAAKGKTVEELVDHMTGNGLTFAPALDGDEAAYQALHTALAGYLAGVRKQAGKE
jgi:hypothetical protein